MTRTLTSSLSFAIATASGCVSSVAASEPELVWGRRGFSDGRFLKPRAITIDDDDQLYIVDTTGRIQVFNSDGVFLRGWSTPQTANGRPTGLAIRRANTPVPPNAAQIPDLAQLPNAAQLQEPILLVADTHYYRMLVYTLDGTLCDDQQIGGTAGHSPGEFAFVTDAVCDNEGCYYIGEYGDSDRIQKFDPEGKFMTQWGGTGSERGQFVRPQSLVVQGDVLWVVDACNHRIQRFDLSTKTPSLIEVIGKEGVGEGEFYYPYDMAFTADGTMIVCEYGNQRLQHLAADGRWIATWGGPGFQPGQLYQPWGVVVDTMNRVHVLDSNNHRVQRLII
ncbi:NHL repeat-containing protein [Novipirellula herctigrandis]